jgi:hypothetical protein
VRGGAHVLVSSPTLGRARVLTRTHAHAKEEARGYPTAPYWRSRRGGRDTPRASAAPRVCARVRAIEEVGGALPRPCCAAATSPCPTSSRVPGPPGSTRGSSCRRCTSRSSSATALFKVGPGVLRAYGDHGGVSVGLSARLVIRFGSGLPLPPASGRSRWGSSCCRVPRGPPTHPRLWLSRSAGTVTRLRAGAARCVELLCGGAFDEVVHDLVEAGADARTAGRSRDSLRTPARRSVSRASRKTRALAPRHTHGHSPDARSGVCRARESA